MLLDEEKERLKESLEKLDLLQMLQLTTTTHTRTKQRPYTDLQELMFKEE